MGGRDSGQAASTVTGILWTRSEGTQPVLDMLKTDLSTFDRYPWCPAPKRPGPMLIGLGMPRLTPTPPPVAGAPSPHGPDVKAAQDFAVASPVNAVVPAASAPKDTAKPAESPLKLGQVGRSYDEAGKSVAAQRGVREYLASGYTRRNPDGTRAIDKDWTGKWKPIDVQLAEKTWGKSEDVAAFKDGFGSAGASFASGNSGIGKVEGAATSAFSITKGGVTLSPISAKGAAAVAQGHVDLNKDGLVSASGDAAFLKAAGSAEAVAILTPGKRP
ncbi:hypothetical protein C8J30_101118 [Rhodobacter viridis]|uniref:Uncharacterized protein n=1 Tax=Rhodobacter viridis TaxID=1054202 RepID=A0A318U278_9RHOB|nr:hypothetical protein [Rhodobacter viridis]PYF12737.1 hypothetical protein C8J30_101118 [Rhodobacter viridis]